MDIPGKQNAEKGVKKKILIVEDDFFIRDLYSFQARKEGYEVVTAADGEEAIAKVRAEKFDLLLVDIMLPKVDGLSVIKLAKSTTTNAQTPCIVITNLEDPSEEREARAAGVVEYLRKIDNTPKDVINKLKVYLQ